MSALEIRPGDCLLIIDVQNDFCTGGALAVPQAETIIPLINQLSQQFPAVVVTQDWHPAGHSSFASSHPGKQAFDSITLPCGEQTLWPDHCIQGSEGSRFHRALDVDVAQLIIRKGFNPAIDSYSAFYENDHQTSTGLGGYLHERGVTRVVCTGLALDFCVRFSAEDARREGFEATVLEDACRGIDLNGSNAIAREAMRSAGVTFAEPPC